MTRIILILLTSLFFCVSSQAQEVQSLQLRPETITFLMAESDYAYSANDSLGLNARRYNKRWWAKAKKEAQRIEVAWKLDAPKEEKYWVVALLDAPEGSKLTIQSPKETTEHEISGGWQRYDLGLITIPEGESEFTLKAPQAEGFAIKSLELLPATQVAAHKHKVAEFRAEGAKAEFQKDIYGLMFTWGTWVLAPDGSQKEFPQQFSDFDTEAWANICQEAGAAFVIVSLSWAEYMPPAPLKTVHSIAPTKTTIPYGGKDYIKEMMNALNKRGIKFFLYYHHGQGDPKYNEGNWWSAVHDQLVEGAVEIENPNMSQKARNFTANNMAILSEVGERYGKGLAGWWVDDGIILYPQDFEQYAKAMRAGNPQRLITYNNWRMPPYTEFQDYVAGEGRTKFEPGSINEKGLVKEGKYEGLIPFGLQRFEQHWAVYEQAPTIRNLPQNLQIIPDLAKQAAEGGYTICFNLMMYEDGSVAPNTLEGLKKAKAALEEMGHERDFAPINQD